VKERIAVLVATWFGSGMIRPIVLNGMAGTYGSIAALPLCFLALGLGPVGYGICLLFVYVIGAWSIPFAEVALGARKDWKGNVKTHDQNQIVIDEVVGMLVTCLPLLSIRSVSLWISLPLGCALFRVFDIMKPYPARHFDALGTADGVMLDDVIAGLYAALVLMGLLVILK